MINRYGLVCIVLLPMYCAGADQQLPDKEKKQEVVAVDSFLQAKLIKALEVKLIEMLTTPLPKPLAKLEIDWSKATSVRPGSRYMALAAGGFKPVGSNFFRYRNEKLDEKLLESIVQQHLQAHQLLAVKVSIEDAGLQYDVEFPTPFSPGKFGIFKQNIASMIQWRGQFQYPIPSERIKIQAGDEERDIRKITTAQQVDDLVSLGGCLRASIDMSDFKKPEVKSE